MMDSSCWTRIGRLLTSIADLLDAAAGSRGHFCANSDPHIGTEHDSLTVRTEEFKPASLLLVARVRY